MIIGKNGTGKTKIMGKLGTVLSSGDRAYYSTYIEGDKPLFKKVIAVSYSFFDDFEKPSLDDNNINKISYAYCGLIDKAFKGDVSSQLKDKLKKAILKIKKSSELTQSWKEILSSILGEYDRGILEEILINPNSIDEKVSISSGHHIILSIFSEVISNIEQESILLIDEPENHLHPNAISNFMKMLNGLLKSFNSYAIISTHSPIIVQETPARYVQVINRNYYSATVTDLKIECFGEDLSNVISHIFNVKISESNYQTVFSNMVKEKGMTFENIEKVFNHKLSLHAKGIILSQFSKGKM